MIHSGDQFAVMRRCPHCNMMQFKTTFFAVQEVPGPDSEDVPITMCRDCGEWSMVIDGFTLRKPTPEERAEIEATDACAFMKFCWQLDRRKP